MGLFCSPSFWLYFRLVRFDGKNWRVSYQALIVLEHLLTHGPESVADEFQSDIDVIMEMGTFQHIDEKGYLLPLSFLCSDFRIHRCLFNDLIQ